ncbi:hypothetical protein KBD34_04505 [Patescibacteria group bacterium]|nr:hypothetical protein [Patescibacteria group bacterium]
MLDDPNDRPSYVVVYDDEFRVPVRPVYTDTMNLRRALLESDPGLRGAPHLSDLAEMPLNRYLAYFWNLFLAANQTEGRMELAVPPAMRLLYELWQAQGRSGPEERVLEIEPFASAGFLVVIRYDQIQIFPRATGVQRIVAVADGVLDELRPDEAVSSLLAMGFTPPSVLTALAKTGS